MTINKVEKKQDLLEFIYKNREKLLSYGIKKIGLFGSFARGDQTVRSDIDLLVEFYPDMKTYRNFIGICNFFEDSLNTSVDVVTIESLSPYIGPHILEEVEYIVLSS